MATIDKDSNELTIFKIPADYSLITFKQVDSTNKAAKRLVNSGNANKKSIIISDEQSNGYGQRGRVWESLKGNLHLSVLLETDKQLKELQELVFLTALVMAKYIAQVTHGNLDIKLKWPNDILIDGKKICGILLETIKFQNKQFVIIGIGVNLSKTPNVQDQAVTSLKKEANIQTLPAEFTSGFIRQFDTEYCQWRQDGNFNKIREEWKKLAYNLHQNVTINNGNTNISGRFHDIDDHGAIILKTSNGQMVTINHGNLVF